MPDDSVEQAFARRVNARIAKADVGRLLLKLDAAERLIRVLRQGLTGVVDEALGPVSAKADRAVAELEAAKTHLELARVRSGMRTR